MRLAKGSLGPYALPAPPSEWSQMRCWLEGGTSGLDGPAIRVPCLAAPVSRDKLPMTSERLALCTFHHSSTNAGAAVEAFGACGVRTAADSIIPSDLCGPHPIS